jgi:hypothetical protein
MTRMTTRRKAPLWSERNEDENLFPRLMKTLNFSREKMKMKMKITKLLLNDENDLKVLEVEAVHQNRKMVHLELHEELVLQNDLELHVPLELLEEPLQNLLELVENEAQITPQFAS